MSVTSRPTTASARPRIGFLRPRHIERAFIALLYTALLALVLLSILGTFYGLRGEDAPIAAPLRMIGDALGSMIMLGVAFSIQTVLTLVQYGARQFAKRDRRWWLLYLLALGVSVYYNIQAYWVPLTALIPWYLTTLLIIGGDVVPELIAVRRSD